MEEIADRIKAVRKALGLTQDEFSSRIAIKRNTLAVIETQKRATSELVIKSICREFGVNLDYLLHGDEPDRKSTRLNSSHSGQSRMPSSA